MKGVKEISLSQFSVEMFLFQYQQHVNVFVVGYESRCGNRLKVCFLFCLFWVLQWLRYIKHWFIFIYRICFYWKTLKTLVRQICGCLLRPYCLVNGKTRGTCCKQRLLKYIWKSTSQHTSAKIINTLK